VDKPAADVGNRESRVGNPRLTFVGRQVVQVYLHGEIVARLGRHDKGAILAVQHFLSTVFDEVLVASYLDRDPDLGLGLGRRDVKDDAVKVGDGLVDRDGSRSKRKRTKRRALN
jgi:hypothetical protein